MHNDYAIITGSTSGIGKAITTSLLSQNYKILGIARNHEKFNPEDSANYEKLTCDLSNTKEVQKLCKTLSKTKPTPDLLILSAGSGYFAALEEMSSEKIINNLNLNLLTNIFLVKAVLPGMKKRRSGKIIFIGSEAALKGKKQGSVYCAGKAALRAFSESLREETANSGIAVSIINPGMVDTPFFDQLKFKPKDGDGESLNTEHVVEAIDAILKLPRGAVIDEINLSPQRKSFMLKSEKN